MPLFNTRKIVTDIRPPRRRMLRRAAKPRAAKPAAAPLMQSPPAILVRRSRLPYYARLAAVAAGIGAAGFVVVSGIGFFNLRHTLVESAPTLIAQFKDARDALTNLETARAHESLSDIASRLGTITGESDRYGFSQLAALWGTVVPQIQRASDAFTQLVSLSEAALDTTAQLAEIQDQGVPWLMRREGDQLIARIDTLRERLQTVGSASASLAQNVSTNVAAGDLLGFDATLYKTTRFLDALAAWLKQPDDHYLLIMFENSSELRPAGGFLGSYAVVTLDPLGVKGISVEDIYDADGQFDRKIAPPRALQPITDRLAARDANWFFDFPASAAKVIELLESSKIYRERQVVFDGALAVTVDVVERLIELTGPIELPEYDLTLTAANFLAEVQREVETGYDNRVLNEPKLILKRAAPILIERLANLSAADRAAVLKQLQEEVANRNLMLYFKDIDLQTYFEDLGAGGEVLDLPRSSAGEYLAVVSANVGGGKSDAFIERHLQFSTVIRSDGTADNYLNAKLAHTGENQRDSWYRAANRSYLQVFTPAGSHLDFGGGFDTKAPAAFSASAPAGFERDADIERIERTAQPLQNGALEQLASFDKTVFAGWVTVPAGDTKMLELRYRNPQRVPLGLNPLPYRIIIERQSGAPASFDLLAETPAGYHWRESGTPLYNYVSDSLPGRTVLDLTIEPDQAAAAR